MDNDDVIRRMDGLEERFEKFVDGPFTTLQDAVAELVKNLRHGLKDVQQVETNNMDLLGRQMQKLADTMGRVEDEGRTRNLTVNRMEVQVNELERTVRAQSELQEQRAEIQEVRARRVTIWNAIGAGIGAGVGTVILGFVKYLIETQWP